MRAVVASAIITVLNAAPMAASLDTATLPASVWMAVALVAATVTSSAVTAPRSIAAVTRLPLSVQPNEPPMATLLATAPATAPAQTSPSDTAPRFTVAASSVLSLASDSTVLSSLL